jgi:hypothetical protein
MLVGGINQKHKGFNPPPAVVYLCYTADSGNTELFSALGKANRNITCGEKRNTYKLLVGNPERKRPLGRKVGG